MTARGAPPSLRVLRAQDHRRMPWRNGAGVTYEVASSSPEHDLDDFDWRISIAEVTAGGPFSSFPGIDRTIVLIEGEWIELTVDGERHRLGIHEPLRFDGGSETTCEVAGPSRDLNVMTRRGRATASVVIATADSVRPEPNDTDADTATNIYVCLAPGVTVVGDDGTTTELAPWDAAVSPGSVPVALHGDGTVAAIRLGPAASATGPGDGVDLEAIRRELEERRDRTRARLAELGKRPELGSAQGFGKRIGDGTTEAVSRLTDIGVGGSLEQTLARAERAIAKLDDGSYGVCDGCGEPISSGRLKALPDGVLCVTCAAAARRAPDPRRR